ncbi:MAG: UDP-3-O-(3-hydroxymyristoyl)glucosamine N-acyltransferase [Deltaproteobacteria bacterium]|nr:UDP-3-O-(3-hydroxymyristoyl)glucosamine N-acyltransferase [Deltaproteobacteria bacterium]
MSERAFTLGELADLVGGEVQGDAAMRLRGVATLDGAGPEHIAFFNHAWYADDFARTRAGAVIVEPRAAKKHPGRAYLVAPNASLAFARVSRAFHPPERPQPSRAGEAFVHPSAQVDPTARIEAFAYVGAGAKIGARTVLAPQSFVGEGAQVGADSRVGVGVKILHGCVVGNRVILQPGVVLGGDGFGFALDLEEGQLLKVPQVGIVLVEDDVEIGANSCVDRATMGQTRIGRGTKIDNLVQVGHNVTVGAMSILCGQVGLAGSCKIGDGAVLGGQAGVANHLRVGDGAKIAGQSGVGSDIPDGEIWSGSPAQPHRKWLRNQQVASELADLHAEVRKLRAEMDALKK